MRKTKTIAMLVVKGVSQMRIGKIWKSIFDGNEYFGMAMPPSVRSTKAYLKNWGKCERKGWSMIRLIESKDGLKQRFDEIVRAINTRDSRLEEFNEEIFNALVERIEILTPAHFAFELRNGMRGAEIKEY